MKKIVIIAAGIILFSLYTMSMSQTKDAYQQTGEEKKTGKTGLLDPSRLTINHSISFGASAGGGYSGLKSQSIYTTMLTYKFSQPVTLNLNFGLPIYSSYYSGHNLNYNNIKSLDYFRDMPISATLTWQPSDKVAVQFHVESNTNPYGYYNGMYSPWSIGPFFPRRNWYEPK